MPRRGHARDSYATAYVPVVHVPSAPRLPVEAGRELVEEHVARQRAEEALADAQGTISWLQVARSRTEQAVLAAQAAVEEREAAMASLRAELTTTRRSKFCTMMAQAA